MIIDCHTHWGMVWEDKYGTEPAEWLRIPDSHGVSASLLMGHRGLCAHSDVGRANDIVAETCLKSGGKMFPLASVHPDTGEQSLLEFERCVRTLGMRGLKLHPWLQGFSVMSPAAMDLFRLAGDLDVPVIFHDGTPVYTMPAQIGGLALNFPKTVFVLGHSGLLELWRSAIEFARKLPNLYLTFCGPHKAGLQAIADRVDEERLLWGTDFGFGFADSIGYRLHLVDLLKITSRRKEKILGLNARRLFKLEPDLSAKAGRQRP